MFGNMEWLHLDGLFLLFLNTVLKHTRLQNTLEHIRTAKNMFGNMHFPLPDFRGFRSACMFPNMFLAVQMARTVF